MNLIVIKLLCKIKNTLITHLIIGKLALLLKRKYSFLTYSLILLKFQIVIKDAKASKKVDMKLDVEPKHI